MIIARRVRVAGRVQGVFYRAWTKEQAGELGVAGWVRNCPDGSVEAHVQGKGSAVDQMIKRMRAGPPHAQVDQLTIEEVAPEESENFAVLH
jgi:acylphosphatase